MATTNSPSNTPNPKSSSNTDNSKQRLIAISAVIIVLLLAVNIFLVIGYNKKGNDNAQLTSQLDESEQLKAELEKQYYEALSELEEMRGSNEELNALIEQQKAELKESKDQIDGLLRSKRNYDKARQEIRNLSAKVEQYVAEINQLKQENEELTANVAQLSEEREQLTTNLDSARAANQELSTARATLVTEKEALEKDRAALSKKVNIASVIKVGEIEVEGQKLKKSGKAVRKRYAKNVEQLEICFNTTLNEIVPNGTEEFVIRIINPVGETVALEDLGSGVFTNEATGEQIRYTASADVDYDGAPSKQCTIWKSDQPYQKGYYDIEVYNKGFLAGSSQFRLK